MVYFLLMVVVHVVIAAVDLPVLLKRPERRAEHWVLGVLLLVSLALWFLHGTSYRPVSVWRLLEAVFSPIGTPIFKPRGH